MRKWIVGEIVDLLPRSEAETRVGRLQEWMQRDSTDCVFVLQNADQFYFSGTVQTGMVCIPASGEPALLVQKSPTRARLESPWTTVIPISGFGQAPEVLAGAGFGNLRKIGLEIDVLPAGHYFRIQELFSGVDFIDASESIRTLRMIKSEHELHQIRQAAEMLDLVFRGIREWLRPGMTELEASARIEGLLRLHGHQGIARMRSFNCELAHGIVSSGASAAQPTCFPGPVGSTGLYPAVPNGASRRPIVPGAPVVIDIVAGFGGYICDQTRTFISGELAPDMQDAHRFTLDLTRKIESMLRPGMECKQIYRRIMDDVKQRGYASSFMGLGDSQVRFIGHGVGLELDELPVLAGGFDATLEPGMVIAVEPKIFFPERGGVGIENTYAIVPAGCEKLTAYEEDIIGF
jgi:Xaa-Pro dipeptidase